jgi:hypothetical protein
MTIWLRVQHEVFESSWTRARLTQGVDSEKVAGLKTAGGHCAHAPALRGGLDRDESLLKTRSYRMSYLDITMAGGVILLLILIVLRKKTR